MAKGDEEQGAAFRTFVVEPPHQVRNLRKMLQTRMADLSAQILGGYAKDWPDYKNRIGVIEGLNEALAFCDELEKAESK